MWIGQYYRWKKGILGEDVAREKLEFFKTNPTDEQIEILDRYNNKKSTVLLLMALGLFILGILLGAMIKFESLGIKP